MYQDPYVERAEVEVFGPGKAIDMIHGEPEVLHPTIACRLIWQLSFERNVCLTWLSIQRVNWPANAAVMVMWRKKLIAIAPVSPIREVLFC